MTETPEQPAARADVACGRTSHASQSCSFIERQLASVVADTANAGPFLVDVFYPDLAQGGR